MKTWRDRPNTLPEFATFNYISVFLTAAVPWVYHLRHACLRWVGCLICIKCQVAVRPAYAAMLLCTHCTWSNYTVQMLLHLPRLHEVHRADIESIALAVLFTQPRCSFAAQSVKRLQLYISSSCTSTHSRHIAIYSPTHHICTCILSHSPRTAGSDVCNANSALTTCALAFNHLESPPTPRSPRLIHTSLHYRAASL